ncbi:MAG: hypothetical protein ACE5IR_05390 [bacterium]
MPSRLLSQAPLETGEVSLFEKRVIFEVDSAMTYLLKDSVLIPQSESVWRDSVLLLRETDYSMDYWAGSITFKTRPSLKSKITMHYSILPFPLQRTFSHRKLETTAGAEDTRKNGESVIPKPDHPTPVNQPKFASQIRNSGSIIRGISVGSNQNLQVDSGLRMQISGQLTDDVEVLASLTDQNTPIQPEGNTQTLREIDKVFVQIKGPNIQATLGDYNLSFAGSEFMRYNRKLQGAMGRAEFKNMSLTFSGAVSRGQFTTYQFLGQEGNQGPYQLQGSNGQINIIVLAGTERVWVDGELMTRGENNDYVIEYGNGQITFSRNRLITADSRVTVDFQFSDESFQRNLWAARAESHLLNDKVQLNTTFIRESDDKNDPLNLILNDDFQRLLEQSGDSLAIAPGDSFVGESNGVYLKDSTGVFIYAGPNLGDHNVRFSFVGENKGDYRNVGLGRFEFVGEDRGNYRPFIVLPQAQRHDLVGLNLNFSPNETVNIKSELAFTQFDPNLYSSKDDGDNQGTAYSIALNLKPKRGSIGEFRLQGKLRRKSATFRDIDRTTQVEFNRKWNLSGKQAAEENINELNGTYSPLPGLSFQGGVGTLSKAGLFKSNRWEFKATLAKKQMPKFDYYVESIDRLDRTLRQESDWLRQRGHAEFNVSKLTPVFHYEGEIRKDARGDTSQTGFRFDSFTAGLKFHPFKPVSLSFRYNVRDDKNRQDGVFVPKSVARTQSFSGTLRKWHAFYAKATYTHRERDFSDSAVQDTRTDLADFKIGYTPRNNGFRGNLYYQISNTQVARQEEIFREVNEGEGAFRFNEELNEFEPDPFGNFVRQFIATDEFIPVIALRMRADLRISPKRFFEPGKSKKGRKSMIEKMFSPLSSQTFFRIDERTTEEEVSKIYLLKLSHFQQDSTTIFGSIELRQDIYLWENSRTFSLRYRYRDRREKNNQLIKGGQNRQLREQSLRILNRFSRSLTTQMEFHHSSEDRIFQSVAREDRMVRSNQVQIDVAYRPQRRLELGLKSSLSFNRDVFAEPATRAKAVAFSPRSNYSLSTKGRFRGEMSWTKVIVSPAQRLIPFELTNGNRVGVTFRWNFGFDYRLSKNVQTSLSYFGRREPDRAKTQHFAKVEMRAFF